MSAEPVGAHEPEPGPQSGPSSPVEEALADLLGAPYDKVSITIPAALKARIAKRAAATNFSAYVTDVLAAEERRQSLIDYLDYMDELYGPPSDEMVAEADRRWEEMWDKYEERVASSSTQAP